MTFSIYDVKSKGVFVLRNCKLASKIDDRNSNYIHTKGGGLLMRSCEFKRVEFHGLTGLRDDLEIAANSIDLTDLKTNEFRLEGCFVENLSIQGDNTEIKKIIIKNSYVKNININCKGIEEVYIQNLKKNKSLGILCDAKLLELSTDKELEGPSYIINSVNLNFQNTSENGRYLFENLTVESLSVSGNNNNYILLRNNFIERITLKNFNNYSGFAIHNSQNIKSLTIQDSSLGKSEFLDVGFSKANSIRIVHSNISEVTLFSTAFPETLTADSVDDFRGLREVYRQLKFVSGKQGDRVNERRYEAYEMNAYKKDLTTHKSNTDKFILFTNQLSNRHGQSAWQALTILILGSALLYGLVKFCQGFPIDLDNSAYTISEYINFFVNPLHDYLKLFNIQEKEEFSCPYPGIARLLDTVGKLFSGYFIFQFLRAFRKFAK